MSAAIRPALEARPKALPLSVEHVVRAATEHMRSEPRKAGRDRSRELLLTAMKLERALVDDIAEALGVDGRGASRAIKGERPFDIGDVICLPRAGRGGARLARRIIAALTAEVDRIELEAEG